MTLSFRDLIRQTRWFNSASPLFHGAILNSPSIPIRYSPFLMIYSSEYEPLKNVEVNPGLTSRIRISGIPLASELKNSDSNGQPYNILESCLNGRYSQLCFMAVAVFGAGFVHLLFYATVGNEILLDQSNHFIEHTDCLVYQG